MQARDIWWRVCSMRGRGGRARRVGKAKRLGERPVSKRAHHLHSRPSRWARFRLRSSSYGGRFCPPYAPCSRREPLTRNSLRKFRPLPARAGRGDSKRFAPGCLKNPTPSVVIAREGMRSSEDVGFRFAPPVLRAAERTAPAYRCAHAGYVTALTISQTPTPCPRCRSTPRVWASALARCFRAAPLHPRSPPPAPSP